MIDHQRPPPEPQNAPPVLDPVAAYALWAADYSPYAHNPFMQAEERALLSLLPTDLRQYRVLDAGCGSGRYILHALQRGAVQVVGVDLSVEMLTRARVALHSAEATWRQDTAARQRGPGARRLGYCLRASLDAIPVHDAWADLTLCGLTLEHLEDLHARLAELCRITRPGGVLLCSDLHPMNRTLGWRREFTAAGQRYAVRHTWHLYSTWQDVCQALGLRIVRVLEPRLDPADIPAGARFDVTALEVPVALVIELRRDR